MYDGNRAVLVFALDVSSERSGYVKATAYVRAVDGQDNIRYDGDNPLAGLEITAPGWTDNRAEAFKYYSVSCDASGSVVESEAERMYKLLKRVRVVCDKMSETYGYPQTFGQYVQRVAKAVGIKEIGFYPPNGASTWASGYLLRTDSPANGARTIDSKLAEWKESAS